MHRCNLFVIILYFEMLCLRCTESLLRTRYATSITRNIALLVPVRMPQLKLYSDQNVYYMDVSDVDGVRRKVKYFDSGGTHPVVIMLSGTAQTINTWSPHFRSFIKSRRLIIPELRCQGVSTELLTEHASIQRHLIDIELILNNLKLDKVDVVGFSFGGRIAIALSCCKPSLTRSLSITGVPLERPFLGSAILQSWREGLSSNSMRECAWSFLLNGYSEAFIERNYHRLPQYVDMICESNDPSRLLSLMVSCHSDDNADPYSVSQCAKHIACPTQIIASANDRIAGLPSVEALSHAIAGSKFHVIDKCGHLLPFENPLEWRKTVLQFLDESSSHQQI